MGSHRVWSLEQGAGVQSWQHGRRLWQRHISDGQPSLGRRHLCGDIVPGCVFPACLPGHHLDRILKVYLAMKKQTLKLESESHKWRWKAAARKQQLSWAVTSPYIIWAWPSSRALRILFKTVLSEPGIMVHVDSLNLNCTVRLCLQKQKRQHWILDK